MSEGAEGEVDRRAGGGFEGCVADMEGGPSAEGGEVITEGTEAVFATGGDDETSSLAGEGDGGGMAYTGAGPGDEGDFALKGERHGGKRLLRLDATIRLC